MKYGEGKYLNAFVRIIINVKETAISYRHIVQYLTALRPQAETRRQRPAHAPTYAAVCSSAGLLVGSHSSYSTVHLHYSIT